jgi:hypothetical protein
MAGGAGVYESPAAQCGELFGAGKRPGGLGAEWSIVLVRPYRDE